MKKRKRTLMVLILLVFFILTGCKRFDDDFTPTVYAFDDVYYRINNLEGLRFNVVVVKVLKEQGKEDIYCLEFTSDDRSFFKTELSETDYLDKIGAGNNAVTCDYTQLSLCLPCKDSKEFDCLLYDADNSGIYSIEDNYVSYNKTNIDGEVEEFLNDVILTQNIQLKETGTEISHGYETGVYQQYKDNFFGWLFTNDSRYSTDSGEEGLNEKLLGFTKYSK